MEFVQRVQNRQTKVGVIGLGYVGLPLVIEFGRKGFTQTGFDVDQKKVHALNSGQSYIHHIPAGDIQALTATGRFQATTDFSKLAEQDAILICVPTPLNEMREPDLTYVEQTARQIAKYLRPGQLVVLESTTYPGTTDELVLPILQSSGLKCTPNDDGAEENTFLLAFSPERVDPGNEQFPIPKVPKVVGGYNAPSRAAATAVYGSIIEQVVEVSSTRAAEMTKLLENIYRCVNIAMVNELKMLCLRMGIDIWEVIAASSTKPYGFKPFYPGPGLGGHCIPIDPYYLSWKAKEFDFSTRFIELAGEVNTAMPYHVVSYLAEALNERKKPVNGSKILLLGLAYKKDVDDLRESPSLKLIDLLQQRGATVEYNDPYIPRLHRTRKYDFPLESVPLTPETLKEYDAVLIATDHSNYDYQSIVDHAQLVVDTRGATRKLCSGREKIVSC